MTSAGHLVRRFRGSLSWREPAATDVEWVRASLREGEWRLWSNMAVQDRRHSIEVAQRFVGLRPEATLSELAGALLHDVGKQVAGLGTFSRVLATVVGPRTERFRQYHDHESIGAAMLHDAGSNQATIDVVQGRGSAAATLFAADDV